MTLCDRWGHEPCAQECSPSEGQVWQPDPEDIDQCRAKMLRKVYRHLMTVRPWTVLQVKRWNQDKCMAPLTSWRFAASPPGQWIKIHYIAEKREKYRWEIVQGTVPLTSKTEGTGPKNSEWNGEGMERIQRPAPKSTVGLCGPCSSHWNRACWSDPSTMKLGINASHSSGLKHTSLVPLRKYFNWTDWIPVWKALGGEMEGKQAWYDSGGHLHRYPIWESSLLNLRVSSCSAPVPFILAVCSVTHGTRPIAVLFCTWVRSSQLNFEVPHSSRR